MKPEWFWHLTLSTGDTRKSYRHEVSDDAIAAMRGMNLLKPKAELLVAGGYRFQTTIDKGGAAFTVFNGEIPLVHCVLAVTQDDAAYWEFIERLYLNITDKTPVDWVLPDKPGSVPWLAIVLLGLHLDIESAQCLGDLERCMACC